MTVLFCISEIFFWEAIWWKLVTLVSREYWWVIQIRQQRLSEHRITWAQKCWNMMATIQNQIYGKNYFYVLYLLPLQEFDDIL